MTPELREKLSKVYELVNNGGTDGEKQAAKAALDRLISKYNIDESMLAEIHFKCYDFKYSTELELLLLSHIIGFFHPEIFERFYKTKYSNGKRVRQVTGSMTYIQWITIEASYEYFRRHMKNQWYSIVQPLIVKARTAKKKNELRSKMQPLFLEQYIIKSKLVHPENVSPINPTELSADEQKRRRLLMGLEGGQYNKQVVSNLLIENR